MTVEDMVEILLNNNCCSEETIQVVTNIDGYNRKTMENMFSGGRKSYPLKTGTERRFNKLLQVE